MENIDYFSRVQVFPDSRPGPLTSRKILLLESLEESELNAEALYHFDRNSKVPTALISVSSRIVDTVHRAFRLKETGDDPADIWIFLICVPKGSRSAPLHAVPRARAIEHDAPELFRFEYLFVGRVPEEYIVHAVSLQFLIRNGISTDWFDHRTTSEARAYIAQDLLFAVHTERLGDLPNELAIFAISFGKKALRYWIAEQLFRDCVRVEQSGINVPPIAAGTEVFVHNITDFLEELHKELDDEFRLVDEEFQDWRVYIENNMYEELVECWEVWHLDRADEDGIINLPVSEMSSYLEAKTRLLTKWQALIEYHAARMDV